MEIFELDHLFYLKNFNHLEIQDFAMPSNLDCHRGEILARYKRLLASYQGTLSVHGPFKDLIPSSFDPMVQQTVAKRFLQALDVCAQLGADTLVVHSCFNPLMSYEGYAENWLENSCVFWDKMMPKVEEQGVTVVLENIWDGSPEHINKLLDIYCSPFFKACLDTGHAHIFSSCSLGDWVGNYGNNLKHIHLHDNNGQADQHLLVGQGSIDLESLFKAFSHLSMKLRIINEAYCSIQEEKAFLQRINSLAKSLLHNTK